MELKVSGCPTNASLINSINPDLVVAMDATAAQSVFGKITPINKNRGHPIDLADGIKALVTVHPSYLLRLPDADAKAREYERFVDDLKIAAKVLRKIGARGLGGVPRMLRNAPGSALRAARTGSAMRC